MRLKEFLTESDDKINDFLAKFGLGPNYKPMPAKKFECPSCKKQTATYVEEHPDTDMNEMVLKCPCGYSNDNSVSEKWVLKEERPIWQTMPRDELKKFRKKCKHDWSYDKSLLSGEFFRCKNCGCEGKQSGKNVRRVFK